MWSVMCSLHSPWLSISGRTELVSSSTIISVFLLYALTNVVQHGGRTGCLNAGNRKYVSVGRVSSSVKE